MTGASAASVTKLARLLPGAGSDWTLTICRRLVSGPTAVGWTMKVTLASPGLVIRPNSQVTRAPAWLQLPWLGSAATNVTPAGSVLVSRTLVALDGPALVTVTVNSKAPLVVTTAGPWTACRPRSADPVIATR